MVKFLKPEKKMKISAFSQLQDVSDDKKSHLNMPHLKFIF